MLPLQSHPMRQKIGVSAALTTPFDRAGRIDWARFTAHAKKLTGDGVGLVTAFGTTGEGASLSLEEKAPLYDEMAKSGPGVDRLVECIYGPPSDTAGRLVGRALKAGAAGILLTPPYYFRGVPEEGIYRWYSEVIERAGADCRDIILYNIPQITGVTIGPALVSRLREAYAGIIAGVKDSSGDWQQTEAMLAEHRDLAILVGNEAHLARAVQRGASGAISGVANLSPSLVAGLVRGEENPMIVPLLEKLLALPLIPAIKAVLALIRGDAAWAHVRAPHLQIEDQSMLAECAGIAGMLRKAG